MGMHKLYVRMPYVVDKEKHAIDRDNTIVVKQKRKGFPRLRKFSRKKTNK